MLKFREIIIRPDVKLPPVSTDRPARPYSFVDFLVEWVVGARELRKDENLPHLFELEEAVEALGQRMEKKSGVTMPAPPDALIPPELRPGKEHEPDNARLIEAFAKTVQAAQKSYNDDVATYVRAVHAASVGEHIYVTDAAFLAAKNACKNAIEAASTPNQQGQTAMPKPYETKILVHYWSFSTSKAVEEHDVPKGAEP